VGSSSPSSLCRKRKKKAFIGCEAKKNGKSYDVENRETDNLQLTMIAFFCVCPFGIPFSTLATTMEINREISFSFPVRPSRVIQQSHPVCNTIMLFGVITCLVSVILLGIDGQFVDSETYPKVS
jgi:hypothetical protein